MKTEITRGVLAMASVALATTGAVPSATADHGATIAALASPASASPYAADVMAQVRALYAGMQTYADSGTVVHEFGSNPRDPSRETHRFRTAFRRPRSFVFDFVKHGNFDRYVVWGDDQAFHSWWRTTGIQYDYPKGRGADAFSGGAVQTAGSVLMVTPLLFARAGLKGPLTQVGDLEDDGKEAINGHDCIRLAGVAKDVYPSGKEVNVHKVIVWIDATSMLIRRVFEDTPKGSMANSVSRYITTFDPVANPKLDARRLTFVPPNAQQ